MKCPRCNSKTRVRDTHPNGAEGRRQDGWITSRVSPLVSWYTPDWVARYRRCTQCPWTSITVELLLEDLKEGWTRSD